jgi:hypothetical protein
MRIRFLSFILFAIILLIAACQGPPPTQIVLVVTATPDSANEPTDDAEISSQTVAEEPTDVPTATLEPSITPTATTTPTPDPFPTPVEGQIYVAEQPFEDGWMFWLQPVGQLWVLTVNEENQGVWSVYEDTFIEGQVEIDPEIVPPEGKYQPERGFGKLWRENPEVREAIGWALEVELGHTTRYEYNAGGSVNDDMEYIPGPGYHLVDSLYGDTFKFNEGSFTWQLED